MNCGFDRELLSMYADGVLDRERTISVESHISGCEECRHELEMVRHLGKVLTLLPRESTPHELIERILAEADDNVRSTVWGSIAWTVSAVWTTTRDGFSIDDDREELLRRESPIWVTRWVLFV